VQRVAVGIDAPAWVPDRRWVPTLVGIVATAWRMAIVAARVWHSSVTTVDRRPLA
jgi:hypothetical protein